MRRRRCRARRRPARGRAPAPATRCSASTAAMCAWWCCTASTGTWSCGQARSEVGAVEVGVQVVRDQGRSRPQDRQQMGRRLVQRTAGRRVVEIADMLRDEGLVAACHANRVLEVTAERQHRRAGRGEADRARREAACTAHELKAVRRIAGHGAQHAVVAAHARCRGRAAGRHRRSRASRASASALPITSGSPPGLALVITSISGCALRQPRRACRPAGRLVEQQYCSGV